MIYLFYEELIEFETPRCLSLAIGKLVVVVLVSLEKSILSTLDQLLGPGPNPPEKYP